MDNNGWKWATWLKMEEIGQKRIKLDELEIGGNWMKLDVNGWMNLDYNGLKWIKEDERRWKVDNNG